MALYEISGTPTGFSVTNGIVYEQNYITQTGPCRTVDACSMKHLEELFFAFGAELIGEGKDCYRLMVIKAPREKARAFPGFKAATARGGRLTSVINKDAAIARAWAQHEENKKRQAAMGIPVIG